VAALLSSFVVVALAEMGDKTQLIALILGLRYRRPWTVMLGILIATIFNHALASALGVWGATKLQGPVLGWMLGLGFIAFGVWTLFRRVAAALFFIFGLASIVAGLGLI
jgi:putative Ca2+/H+ antiporter (TMEM165/GDT1 family)